MSKKHKIRNKAGFIIFLQNLRFNFLDFKKAFDSIHRQSLWRIMHHYGIPTKMVYIKDLYLDSNVV